MFYKDSLRLKIHILSFKINFKREKERIFSAWVILGSLKFKVASSVCAGPHFVFNHKKKSHKITKLKNNGDTDLRPAPD